MKNLNVRASKINEELPNRVLFCVYKKGLSISLFLISISLFLISLSISSFLSLSLSLSFFSLCNTFTHSLSHSLSLSLSLSLKHTLSFSLSPSLQSSPGTEIKLSFELLAVDMVSSLIASCPRPGAALAPCPDGADEATLAKFPTTLSGFSLWRCSCLCFFLWCFFFFSFFFFSFFTLPPSVPCLCFSCVEDFEKASCGLLSPSFDSLEEVVRGCEDSELEPVWLWELDGGLENIPGSKLAGPVLELVLGVEIPGNREERLECLLNSSGWFVILCVKKWEKVKFDVLTTCIVLFHNIICNFSVYSRVIPEKLMK